MFLFPASTTAACPDFVDGRCKIQAEKIQTGAGFTIASAQLVNRNKLDCYLTEKVWESLILTLGEGFSSFSFAKTEGTGLFIVCD